MKSITFLKSISNETKLRLVSLLIENELCVCEFEEITNIRQVNISKNLISLKESYYRLQIANPKKRSAMTPKRFYSDIISSDKYFKESYRSYKLTKLTSLKVTQINTQFIT